MNHSCDSGNGFVHQDDFNLYEEIEKNDYQDIDDGKIKLKHICEHLLHLLNEKGNFSPTTQRLFTNREINLENYNFSFKRPLLVHKRNDSYLSKHKKRKSDGITPDMMRSILVDVSQNESNINISHLYDDISNVGILKNDHLMSNYPNFQCQSDLIYSDSPPINIDQEISPTVSPLPITYPSDIEYELSSMATGEIKYESSAEFLHNFNNDEFSTQGYDNFYFNEF